MNTEGDAGEAGGGTNSQDAGPVDRDARPARAVVLVFAAFLLAGALLIFLLAAPKKPLPVWNRPILGRAALVMFLALVAAIPGLVLVKVAFHKTRGRMVRGVKRLVLFCIASVISIGAFDIFLTAYPDLQSSFVPATAIWPMGKHGNTEDERYGFRGQPNINDTFIFDPAKEGGLVSQDGRWPPTGEKKITFTVVHDANGFSNAEVPKSADWVVVGDSFALELCSPDGKQWLTALREQVKGGLYDIAVNGWGPDCEWPALQEYGFPLKPRVVVWAFYEGNDLMDIAFWRAFKAFQQQTGQGWAEYITKESNVPPPRFPYNRPFVRLLLHIAELLNPPAPSAPAGSGPIMLTVGGRSLPQAFHPFAFMQMVMEREYLQQWFNWQAAYAEMSRAVEMCKARGIAFVLLYFPDKARIFLPLIEEQIDREKFYASIASSLPAGWCDSATQYFERADANAPNVCNMMKALCEEKGVLFIDTTDSLRNAVRSGVSPYWAYDTHFSFDGHKVVTGIVLEELRKAKLLPSTESPQGAGGGQ
jgi:hypothetical protein